MSLCFRTLPGRLTSLVSGRKPLSKLDRYHLRKHADSSVFLKEFLGVQRTLSVRASSANKTPVFAVAHTFHRSSPMISLDVCDQWNKKSVGNRLYRFNNDSEWRGTTYWSQLRKSHRTHRLSTVSKSRKHVVPTGTALDDVTVLQMRNVVDNDKNNSFLNDNRTFLSILENSYSISKLNIDNGILLSDSTSNAKVSQHQSQSQDDENKPSQGQLQSIFDCLNKDLPHLFTKPLDYHIYSKDLIFINNIRGTVTQGVLGYMKQIAVLRTLGHLKYAYVKFDVIKITMHTEDATIKVRWRIRGISGWRIFLKFWRFKVWNIQDGIERDNDVWHDGFSTYYVNGEGKVYKHIMDKMMPQQDVVEKKDLHIAPKLALSTGLTTS